MVTKRKKKIAAFSIPPALRSPVCEGAEITVLGEDQYAFFLKCFELYRVIELADRTLDAMIETYSKYRTRDIFRETFLFRHFDSELRSFEGVHPRLNSTVTAMFNRVHELRISLLFEDALPYTVKTRIQGSLSELKNAWNDLVPEFESQYGWRLNLFSQSEF